MQKECEFSKSFKIQIEKVSKAVKETDKYLIKDSFSYGLVTQHQHSTGINLTNLQNCLLRKSFSFLQKICMEVWNLETAILHEGAIYILENLIEMFYPLLCRPNPVQFCERTNKF